MSARAIASGRAARLGDAALLAPSAVAVALGAWQLDRRRTKIEAVERRRKAIDRSIDGVDDERGRSEEEYAPRVARGTLDATRVARVGPRARSVCGVTQSGSLLVQVVNENLNEGDEGERTGLRRLWTWTKGSEGRSDERTKAIMVARGWVPDSWQSESEDEANKRCVKIHGVVRFSERPGMFTPKNDAERGRWYWLDAPALAESFGLPRTTPLIQAVRERASDVHGDVRYPLAMTREELMTFAVSPEQHLGYAATWFALSACTGAMAVARLRRGFGHRI